MDLTKFYLEMVHFNLIFWQFVCVKDFIKSQETKLS